MLRPSAGCASRIKLRFASLTEIRAVSGLGRNALALRVFCRFAFGSFLAFVKGNKDQGSGLECSKRKAALKAQSSKLRAKGSRLKAEGLRLKARISTPNAPICLLAGSSTGLSVY